MALFLKALLLVLLWLCCCQAGDHFAETWVSCSADQSALAASSVQKSSFSSQSLLRCLSLGTHFNWVVLACFSPARVGQECELWGFEAFNAGSVVKDPSLGQTPCKTLRRQQGCKKPDGTMVQTGTSYPSYPDGFCPALLIVCQADNTFNFQGALPPLTKCAFPFTMTTIGCIYIVDDTSYTWCQARQRCLQYGGDLLSTDTQADFTAIQAYMMNKYGNSILDFWVGLNKETGVWLWMFSGRSPGPNNQGDWASSDPNGANDLCGKLHGPKQFTMADADCGDTYYAICSARLVPKQ